MTAETLGSWIIKQANIEHCSPAQQVNCCCMGSTVWLKLVIWSGSDVVTRFRCQWYKEHKKERRRRKQKTECKGTWEEGGWDFNLKGRKETVRETNATREESHIPPLRHHPGSKHGWSGMQSTNQVEEESVASRSRADMKEKTKKRKNPSILTCLKHVNASLRSVLLPRVYREGALLMLCARHQSKWSPWLMREQIIGSQKSGINTHCNGSE